MPEGLITLSKHACFGGAVSFHEHRSETCHVTMRFAVYAPPRRVLDPAVAQEEQLAARSLLINSSSPPMLDGQTYCNPYCNRASTHWYAMDRSRGR